MNDKKNILIVFLGSVVLFFAYFSYEQNRTISILNREIIHQAQKRHKAIMQSYALQKQLEQLKLEHQIDQPADTTVRQTAQQPEE